MSTKISMMWPGLRVAIVIVAGSLVGACGERGASSLDQLTSAYVSAISANDKDAVHALCMSPALVYECFDEPREDIERRIEKSREGAAKYLDDDAFDGVLIVNLLSLGKIGHGRFENRRDAAEYYRQHREEIPEIVEVLPFRRHPKPFRASTESCDGQFINQQYLDVTLSDGSSSKLRMVGNNGSPVSLHGRWYLSCVD